MTLKLDAKRRSTFLTQLQQDPNVSKAARLIDVSRDAIYKLRERDKEFAAAWDNAIEVATDYLEAEARRRAFNGVPKVRLYQGEPVMVQALDEVGAPMFDDDGVTPIMTPLIEYEYSDRMMELFLKAHRGEKFKEKTEVNHTGGAILQITEHKSKG